jgi:hypothetical protein
MEYCIFSGTKERLLKKFLEHMSYEDACKLINNLNTYNYLLDEYEYVRIESHFAKISTDTIDMMLSIDDSTYFINLKTSTFSIILLLLDTKLTKGFATLVKDLFGINSRSFSKINEFKGEKCVIIETAKYIKNKACPQMFIESHNSECVNNNLKCKYQIEGKCSANIKDIKGIFEHLYELNIFTKKDNLYKCNW